MRRSYNYVSAGILILGALGLPRSSAFSAPRGTPAPRPAKFKEVPTQQPVHRPDPCVRFRGAGIAHTGAYTWRNPPRLLVSAHHGYSLTFTIGKASKRHENRFTIRLANTLAPHATNMLVFLACRGYYTGSSVYRVVGGRLMEMGSPRGGHGPGFALPVEPVHGSYVRGAVALVDPGSPTEGGRFVVLLDRLVLPPRYTIVGSISHGIDIVDALSRVHGQQQPDAADRSQPAKPLIVTAVSLSVT